MNLNIRPYRDEDITQAGVLWSLAFNGGKPYPEEKLAPREGIEAIVAEVDGVIAGSYVVIDMKTSCRRAILPGGGIARVAVLPEYRQYGIGKKLMNHAVAHMCERGMAISLLHGVRENYYRRFGWESIGKVFSMTCPINCFPKFEQTLSARRLTIDDWEQLAPTYRKFASRYSGMCDRERPNWSQVYWSKVETPPQVYAVGDPVEGYAILRMKPGLDSEQEVSELVWSTPEGYHSIMAALHHLGFNGPTLSWLEPEDGPYLSAYFNVGAGKTLAKLLAPVMYRALDVPTALRAIPAEGSGSFTLEIDDEIVPGNRGPWRVTFSDEGVEVEKCTDAGISMHIRHFSQALLGDPCFAQLVANGMASVKSEADAQAAARLLPHFPTYCLDYF
jgi:predicted acetyltransferase